jgi:DNA-binding PadR family transcriptional regulator
MGVREGLLVLLADRPRHGYELKTLFEQRTGALWSLNTGQIYTTLERLERDDLVEPTGEVEGDARRRGYRLTATGRKEAAAWLEASTAADTPRDELVMKVLLLATGDDGKAALDTIDAHRHALLARLQDVRRRQRAQPDDLGARLVADALAVRAEADLRWLDLVVERLQRAPAPGAGSHAGAQPPLQDGARRRRRDEGNSDTGTGGRNGTGDEDGGACGRRRPRPDRRRRGGRGGPRPGAR